MPTGTAARVPEANMSEGSKDASDLANTGVAPLLPGLLITGIAALALGTVVFSRRRRARDWVQTY